MIRNRAGETAETSGCATCGLPSWLNAISYREKSDEGLEVLAAALAHAEESGERFCAEEFNRLRGELLLMRQPSEAADAEAAFRTAIDVSRGQQARWFELRATASLARLLAKQGKRDEARAMLAEIYSWFTEGFDAADLKDANRLLEELSS